MDRPLGERCLLLILNQNRWIHRRVESVSFFQDGETRRNISFDLRLPTDVAVHHDELLGLVEDANSTEKNDQTVLPLTFMRKGALVNLDAHDQEGNSIAVLGYTDNGKISLSALEYASGSIFKDYPRVNRRVIKLGLKEVIYSKSVHIDILSGEESWQNQHREADTLRRQYLLRLLSALESEGALPNIPLPSQIGYWCYLLFEYLRLAVEDQNDLGAETRNRLSIFIALLVSVSESYIFAVLTSRTEDNHRSVVKISFDSQKKASYQVSGLRRGINRRVGASAEIAMKISGYGARSTHVEFNTTPAMMVTAIKTNLKPEVASVSAGLRASSTLPRPRKVGTRTHFIVNHRDRLPVLSTILTLGVRWTRILPLFFLSLFTSVFILAVGFLRYAESNFAAKYYTADNTIALSTLVFAVWAVTIFTGNRYRPESKWIVRSGVLQGVSFAIFIIVATLITLYTDGEGDYIESDSLIFFWVILAILAMISLGISVVSCCLLISAARRERYETASPSIEILSDERLKDVENKLDESETSIYEPLLSEHTLDVNALLVKYSSIYSLEEK